jgi:ribose transport system ATP-binding protein
VNGQPARFRTPADAIAAGIATVFQDPALIPDLTVAQNLLLSQIDMGRLRTWLAWFDLDHLDLNMRVRELPLETLRLVDLARAAARDPHVLLLDEITAALTADQAERVFALLRRWKTEGKAAVLITHRLTEIMRICDQATILRDGRNAAELATANIDEHRLVEAMRGESPDSAEPTRVANVRDTALGDAGRQTALEARDISSRAIVQNVSFTVRAGEIVGLVALEGQGQDRLFDLLAGKRKPTAGEIALNGRPVRFNSPYDAVREGVVLVPGDRLLGLLPNQSVRHNLSLPLFGRLSRWGRIPNVERPRVNDAIEQLSIDTRAASHVRRLSGGNQQKVVIGRWLVAGFQTLLCFDPTRGIDIQTKRDIHDLLRKLAAEGAAILLYTSELAEIPRVCDRVLVMHGGRIVDEQAAAGATESMLLAAAHGLESPA